MRPPQNKRLRALWPCCTRLAPARSQAARTNLSDALCAVGLFVFLQKSEPRSGNATVSAASSKQTAAHALAVLHAVRPARWPCFTANVRGSQTARTDLRDSLCIRRLALGYSWTDPVRWFSGAVQRVHACLGDCFPALFADAFRRHLPCTDKHCQNPARLVPQDAQAKDLVEHAQPCAQQPCQRAWCCATERLGTPTSPTATLQAQHALVALGGKGGGDFCFHEPNCMAIEDLARAQQAPLSVPYA